MAPVTGPMKHFMGAEQFAVLGRVMTDPSRWDNKVYRWYTARELPVTPVKPDAKPDEILDGVSIQSDITALPDLSKTSISIILNPVLSLPILRSLYPSPSGPDPAADSKPTVEPRAVWFQPGAADEKIRAYVKERRLEGQVVLDGCVLVSGDSVRASLGNDAGMDERKEGSAGQGKGRL